MGWDARLPDRADRVRLARSGQRPDPTVCRDTERARQPEDTTPHTAIDGRRVAARAQEKKGAARRPPLPLPFPTRDQKR